MDFAKQSASRIASHPSAFNWCDAGRRAQQVIIINIHPAALSRGRANQPFENKNAWRDGTLIYPEVQFSGG